MVNPLWLHTLVVVHETGSFTRAADRLDLTQAAVSQHISRLEAEFGPLLLRKPRQLELTPRGLVLLDFARQQAQAAEQLRARLSDDDPHRGAITLTTPGSIGLLLYPCCSISSRCIPDSPSAPLCPHPRHSAGGTGGAQRSGTGGSTAGHPSITAEPFAREPLCLVVPNDGEEPSWQHLCQLGFIDHRMAAAWLSTCWNDAIPASASTRSRCAAHQQDRPDPEPVARGLALPCCRFAVTAFAQQEKIRVLQSRIEVIDTLWLIYRASGRSPPATSGWWKPSRRRSAPSDGQTTRPPQRRPFTVRRLGYLTRASAVLILRLVASSPGCWP
jgi:DNA-binding transcriptional LysR family regulator